jgi:hypothetical protein
MPHPVQCPLPQYSCGWRTPWGPLHIRAPPGYVTLARITLYRRVCAQGRRGDTRHATPCQRFRRRRRQTHQGWRFGDACHLSTSWFWCIDRWCSPSATPIRAAAWGSVTMGAARDCHVWGCTSCHQWRADANVSYLHNGPQPPSAKHQLCGVKPSVN